MDHNEPETFDFDVFLSHSPKDTPVVRALAERLRRSSARSDRAAARRLRERGLDHDQENVHQAIHRDSGRMARCPALRPGTRSTSFGRQAHQLGRQLHVQHRERASARVDRTGPDVRQASTMRSGCSARVTASTASPTVPTPSSHSNR